MNDERKKTEGKKNSDIGLAEIAKLGISSNGYTLSILAMALALILVPMVIIMALPVGDLFQTSESISLVEDKVYDAVTEAYNSKRSSAKKAIMDFVNKNYDAKAKLSDITEHNGIFTVDTNTAYITVSFSPELTEMKDNICAYINSVNGTIAFLGEEIRNEAISYKQGTHERPDDFTGQIFTTNIKGEKEFTKESIHFYKTHANELTDTENEEYINQIKAQSNTFFVFDENTERWELENFHIAPKTHQEVRTYFVVDLYGNVTMHTETVNVTLPAWYGHINILMFYDLSDFKEDELNKCVENLKESTATGEMEPFTVINSIMNSYYDNYIGSTNGYLDENGEYVIATDNRNELFRKLLEDGTLMYVPISGLTSNFLEGEAGYSGDCDLSVFDDSSRMMVWKHVQELRNEGKVSKRTYMWNCTAFAAAWFYDLYGRDELYGNGRDMVNNLLNSKWGKEHFYRGTSPAPGGIYSIGSPAGGNHVGCVDAVDFEKGTITISDGNTNGAGNSTSTVRIKKTMTFNEFEAYVKACCSAYGSTKGAWVSFANPIPESF